MKPSRAAWPDLRQSILTYLGRFESFFQISPGRPGRAARITLYFLLAGGYNFLTYIPLFLYLRNWPVSAGLILGVLACWGSLFYIRSQNIHRAAWIAIIGSYVALTFNSIWLGGVFSINDLYIIPVAMVGWLVFGGRLGLRLALFCALSSLLLFLVHIQVGSIFSWPLEQGGLAHAAMTVAFKISLMFIVFALIFVFHHFLTDALETTEQLNATMSAILSSDIAIGLAIFDANLKLIPGSSSAYFQEKFGHIDLKTLVEEFDGMPKSVLISALELLIDQDRIAWEMNVGNLPEQATIRGERHHLQWRPIVVHDVVRGILFSANNIESLLQARAAAESKNKEAHLLAHLVGLGPSKVCDFIDRARFQWSEAQRYYRLGERRQLFITLHTLKGSSRTLGFSDLAELIHKLESRIDELHDQDFHELDQELAHIEVCIDALGYSLELLMVPRQEARKSIRSHTSHTFLVSLAYPSLEELVLSFETEISKTARKLGKIPPLLKVHSPSLPHYISDEAKHALHVALIHTLRNTLDHGIETPDERQRTGKPETPHVDVTIIPEDDGLIITIKDDGRGLNLEAIRSRAGQLNLNIVEKSTEELANLIFEPGFSTRSEVTDISGRGIGMDAIRSHMEEIGGRALIHQKSETKGYGFELCLYLPKTHLLEDILESRTLSTSA